MNLFGEIILFFLLLRIIVNFIADDLNMTASKAGLPPEFAGEYDADTYRKTQEYTSVRTKFGMVEEAFSFAVLLFFWFAGGFNWLDIYLRAWGFGDLVTGLLYIGALALGSMLLSLPFGIYSTFVIEEKFGFNRTTAGTFILDILKSIALAALVGGPILAAVLAFFMWAGVLAWLYAWVFATVVMLFIYFIAPVLLYPLFFKFTPLEDGELKSEIYLLSQKLQFPISGIYVIDGSRRSSKSNAFFTGFGKTKRIALFDTLVSGYTVKEILAVLGHEIGHCKKRHVTYMLVSGIVEFGIELYLLSFLLGSLGFFAAFRVENFSVYAGLVLMSIVYSVISQVLSALKNMASRKFEYEADEYSIRKVGLADEMISCLKKLGKDTLSNLTPHPLYVFMHYSHPAPLARFEAIKKLTR
ncbi:M48 family metallopeptidase [Candidatus Giovannonibacteria bacterium]|nr:M48 family metallopeptidase [Candidatus Giovannonibacteria bacterium]